MSRRTGRIVSSRELWSSHCVAAHTAAPLMAVVSGLPFCHRDHVCVPTEARRGGPLCSAVLCLLDCIERWPLFVSLSLHFWTLVCYPTAFDVLIAHCDSFGPVALAAV